MPNMYFSCTRSTCCSSINSHRCVVCTVHCDSNDAFDIRQRCCPVFGSNPILAKERTSRKGIRFQPRAAPDVRAIQWWAAAVLCAAGAVPASLCQCCNDCCQSRCAAYAASAVCGANASAVPCNVFRFLRWQLRATTSNSITIWTATVCTIWVATTGPGTATIHAVAIPAASAATNAACTAEWYARGNLWTGSASISLIQVHFLLFSWASHASSSSSSMHLCWGQVPVIPNRTDTRGVWNCIVFRLDDLVWDVFIDTLLAEGDAPSWTSSLHAGLCKAWRGSTDFGFLVWMQRNSVHFEAVGT